MMVRIQLDEILDAIAGGENLRVQIFNLVSWAERNGRVDDLIRSAYKETPGNEALQQLLREWPVLSRSDVVLASPLSARTIRTKKVSVDLFLSYSHKDRTAMNQVLEALRAAGLSVWIDEGKGLTPGSADWQDAITEAIGQAIAMVVLLSPDAKASQWVNNEILYAQNQRKSVFPLLVRGDGGSAVPLSVTGTLWIDGRKNLREAVSMRLLPEIRQLLPDTVPVASPSRRVQSNARPNWPSAWIVLLATLSVVVLAWLAREWNPLSGPSISPLVPNGEISMQNVVSPLAPPTVAAVTDTRAGVDQTELSASTQISSSAQAVPTATIGTGSITYTNTEAALDRNDGSESPPVTITPELWWPFMVRGISPPAALFLPQIIGPLPRPDLQIVSISVKPAGPLDAATHVEFEVAVQNTGNIVADTGFYVDLFVNPKEEPPNLAGTVWTDLCRSEDCRNDDGITWLVPPTIAPGEILTLTSRFDVDPFIVRPSSKWDEYLPAGDVTLWAYVDVWDTARNPWGLIEELTETNNRLGPVNLKVAEANTPDANGG